LIAIADDFGTNSKNLSRYSESYSSSDSICPR
jgi:hypothetical protein